MKKVNELVCSKRDHSYFCNGCNTPARTAGGGKNAATHNGGEPFAPGKSRIDFYSHRECMEETHEYANELGKQGGKNPRKIPKFSINHERFSRTIENVRRRYFRYFFRLQKWEWSRFEHTCSSEERYDTMTSHALRGSRNAINNG